MIGSNVALLMFSTTKCVDEGDVLNIILPIGESTELIGGKMRGG